MSTAETARSLFIHEAQLVAEQLGSEQVLGLEKAARRYKGGGIELWARLRVRLLEWADTYDPASAKTRVLFNGLSGSLGADVRWAQPEGVKS